ncbi:HesA/MoeB/ThiF family protein [Kangiella spongicola]|uniref:Molybdopterin-synthase adenylyltransferase n=1 Tax=Kangiella spongicola TaxID=796379 RepID=A0A318D1R5_9GAMM|nr:HesA/MoeB/ThiF family protein [Kangiella spongicola]PXF62753.1 molybdopterin-synthase adenylyltransferase MoeB [Kangiella spongicola]
MLTQEELLQYSRHIILPEIDLEGQERIKNSHVLIIGAGGLGSPAAMYLAAAGVGRLTLVDDDHVERSNLQRQIIHRIGALKLPKVVSAKESLNNINPNVDIRAIEARATIDLLDELLSSERYSAVLDCTDNFETRFMLNKASVRTKTPLVSASAVAFTGQLAVFNLEPEHACYQCLYSDNELPEGDCTAQGILSPVVGTMGTLQATEVLKIILDLSYPSSSFMMNYQSLHSEFKTFKVKKDPNCTVCG